MRRRLQWIAYVIVAGAAAAQPTELRVAGTTPQQAVMEYSAPDANACQLAVTDESGMGVGVWDVSGSVFANANLDLSRANTTMDARKRRVVVGKRSTEVGTDGKLYSRSLQANTEHSLTVTCTGGPATVRFKTLNPPVGNMAPDPPAFDPAGFGNAAWPTINWANRQTVYIDPKTGILLRPAGWPGDVIYEKTNVVFRKEYDAAGTWTNAANILSGNTSQLASSSTTDPMFVALNVTAPSGSSNWVGMSVIDMRVKFFGNGGGSTQQVDFCLSADSGQTCISGVKSVSMPGSNTTRTFPATGALGAIFPAWSMASLPQHNLVMPVSTTVNGTGTQLVNQTGAPSPQGLFATNLAPGSKVEIPGSGCLGNLCTIASVNTASSMTLVENIGTLTGATFRSANFGLKVWKHAAGGSLNLSLNYDIGYTGTPTFLIEDGASDQCNRTAITLNRDGNGNSVPAYSANLCLLGYPGASLLYVMIPATGEMRAVGVVYTIYGNGMSDVTNPRLPQNPWSTTDGRMLFGHGTDDNGSPQIVRWVYRGQGKRYTPGSLDPEGVYRVVPNGQSDGSTSCQGSEQQAGNMCASLVTNTSSGHDLRTQAAALNRHMADGAFGNNPQPVAVVGNQFVSRWFMQQDGIALFTYVNLSNGVMTAAADTMWSALNGRWGGMHTAAGWVIGNRYHLANVNPLGSRSNSGPFAGPYKSLVSAVWRSTDGLTGTWDANTALTTTYNYPCPASECGSVVQKTLQLRIAGMPCGSSGNANEKAKYPCPWDAQKSMLDSLQVGDLLGDFAQPAGGAISEELRILKITRNATTDIVLWVERGIGPHQTAFANGWSVSPYPSYSCTSGAWWYDSTAPMGAIVPDDCALAGHLDVGAGPGDTFSSTVTSSAKFGQPSSVVGIGTPLYQLGGFGTWMQKQGSSDFPGNGRVEFYPSLRQWSAPETEKVWAADWRAYQGGSFTASGGGTAQDGITFTQVTVGGRTHVWKATPSYPVVPKILPMETWAGRFLFQDKSGPNSNLIDADDWSYCVVYKAGECISGGGTVAGQVYFSAKSAIVSGSTCYTNHFEAALPCLVPASPVGTWAVQQDISVNDPYGWRFRRLTMAFNAPSRQYTATNWRATPDGKWGLMVTTFADGVYPVMFAARIPPWPGYDGIRRDQLLQKSVQLGPGEALAEIRFGYEEYGQPGQFYCTSRKEACATGTLQPFQYIVADGHVGKACANGCTISIPSLSGRILWWQEFRSGDGGATWTARGQLQSVTVE
ncbi:MAG: hypothetical protein WDO18_02325 [Acidobacteriota bacterium]